MRSSTPGGSRLQLCNGIIPSVSLGCWSLLDYGRWCLAQELTPHWRSFIQPSRRVAPESSPQQPEAEAPHLIPLCLSFPFCQMQRFCQIGLAPAVESGDGFRWDKEGLKARVGGLSLSGLLWGQLMCGEPWVSASLRSLSPSFPFVNAHNGPQHLSVHSSCAFHSCFLFILVLCL